MLPLAAYYDDFVQVALTGISAAILVVSVNAYRRRREGRYLLLMLAFAFLFVASLGTTALSVFAGARPATFQMVELYVIPSVELLMGVSFLVALLWSSGKRRRAETAFAATVVAVVLVASMAYVSGPSSTTLAPLPVGCARPASGFLIVGSSLGYNDSILHGAPTKPWPILDVNKGSEVTITVCNAYTAPLGFQVAHYFDDKVESINPGQSITVSFLADETGTFLIYCSIFSPIHTYLQGGQVNVVPA